MMLLFKAAAAGLAGSVVGLLLRRSAPELGFAVTAAVTLLAAALGAEVLSGLTELYTLLETETGLSPALVTPVLKCVGIGIVTRLSAELCRDAGQGAAAAAVEVCGTACALVTALPLIRSLMELVTEYV